MDLGETTRTLEDLETLSATFRSRVLAPGEVLWRQAEPATSIAVVTRGALLATIDDGSAEVVSTGNLVGEAATLTRNRRSSTLTCHPDGPAAARLPRHL